MSFFFYKNCCTSDKQKADLGEGGWIGWLATPHYGEAKTKMTKIVNIMAESKANTLDRRLIVIYSLWLIC